MLRRDIAMAGQCGTLLPLTWCAYTGVMPERSRKKRPADLNRLAASIVADATEDGDEDSERDPYEGKNPAAVELGRHGGLKGGRARAAKLTPEQRSEIARKAAAARWRGRSS